MPTEIAPQLVLDIGTHKVLGLAAYPTADGIDVRAAAMQTYESRAMRDGQVHDVPAVAATVRRVVSDLEQTVGASFAHACIAAAGRALHTARGRAELREERPIRLTEEMWRTLTWDAVADAQANLLAELPKEEHVKGFYCIAHSRTRSMIDDQLIGSLVEQRGSRFVVEVLATFLPGVVVDSLQAVLHAAGLQAEGLTLEPVAALEAIVPETLRHLNLMLIDIGAGTTDIAFTGGGTVQAFAMVPMGGDAFTEALATRFLLDFVDAEKAKRQASLGGRASVQNVLGEEVIIDKLLLQETIEPTTNRLAEAVVSATSGWHLEATPEAVLLIGGGSNTPGLAQLLATKLNMPLNRVAVRDRSAVRGVTGAENLQGPDVVTALGIALRFRDNKEMPPVRVRVNGRPVSLFQPERCTVREAARIAGIPLHHIVGRLGQGLTVTVNGALMTVPGRRGRPATVLVNGQPATFDTVLQSNDDVELTLPEHGDDARLTVGQLIDRWSKQQNETGQTAPRIQINGAWHFLPVKAMRHGVAVQHDESVMDRDEFEFTWPRTVGDLLKAADFGIEAEKPFHIILNGKPLTLSLPAELRLNGKPVGPSAGVRDGDRLDSNTQNAVPLYELLSLQAIDPFRLVDETSATTMPAPGDSSSFDNDVRRPRKLVFFVRGEKAGFTTLVNDGDEVTIRYE